MLDCTEDANLQFWLVVKAEPTNFFSRVTRNMHATLMGHTFNSKAVFFLRGFLSEATLRPNVGVILAINPLSWLSPCHYGHYMTSNTRLPISPPGLDYKEQVCNRKNA
jgi:hypothetical protein